MIATPKVKLERAAKLVEDARVRAPGLVGPSILSTAFQVTSTRLNDAATLADSGHYAAAARIALDAYGKILALQDHFTNSVTPTHIYLEQAESRAAEAEVELRQLAAKETTEGPPPRHWSTFDTISKR